MQPSACHALRLVTSKSLLVPCRFLTGRRFPTSHRYFRAVPAQRRQDEPSDPPEVPEDVRNIIHQFVPVQSQENTEAAAEQVIENGQGPPSNGSSSKDAGPYGSASRRAFRNVKKPPPSPPQLPTWFLNDNVTLREHNDINPDDLDVLREHRVRQEQVREIKAIARRIGKHDFSSVTGPESTKAADNTPGEASVQNTNAEEQGSHKAFYALDSHIWLEVKAMIAAGLNIPRDSENASSMRPHIMLHCPQEGGTFFLDFLTQYLALSFDADLIRIDAQDIAEIGGRYIRDFRDMNGTTLSALGYEAYQTPAFRENQENDDMMEDEGDPSEEEEDHRRPKSIAFPKTNISMVPLQVSGGNIAEIFKNLGIMGGGNSMPAGKVTRQFITSQAPSVDNKDLKMSLLIEALLAASDAKRKTQPGLQTSSEMPASNGEPSEEQASESLSEHATEPAVEPTEESSDVAQHIHAAQPSQNLIIFVRDYHEINTTQNGSRIMERLHEIVERKRGEGHRVMIIGTTTAEELIPSASKSGLRSLQSDQTNQYIRTILAPSTAPSADTQFAEDAKTRVEDINIRHIRDMLRRISPDPSRTDALLSAPEFKIDTGAVFASGMDETVWSMDKVHRVVTMALGNLEKTEEMKSHHIETAIILLDVSDSAKVKFLEKEAINETQRSNLLNRNINQSPVPSDERMRKLRKTCNSHEKKLLHGVIDPSAIRTTFAEVRAPSETVEALKTLTSLSLVRPDAFTYGVLATDRIPGLLLYGPPGTGKTLLAKAVAKESGATVLEVSGSDVYDMYVGEGEKNVRAIFTLAKKLAPCIVFIDEADAILGSRGGSSNRTTHRELINQFLREWDGMTETNAFIMVATNRPFDLDEASLRRLPRRLLVDLPTEQDREAILGIHLQGEQLAKDVSLSTLASQTPFYSGSDLKNLAVAAALACVREEFDTAAAAAKATSSSSLPSSTSASIESSSSLTPQTPSIPSSYLPVSFSAHPLSAPSPTSSPVPKPYTYPAKRTLTLRHFTRAMEEISASISEALGSLTAIRKFDEKYGDRRGRRKKLGGYGFGTVKEGEGGQSGKVRRRL